MNFMNFAVFFFLKQKLKNKQNITILINFNCFMFIFR